LSFRFHFGRWAAAASLLAVSVISLLGGTDEEDQLKCATLLAFVQNAHWTEQLAANAPLAVGVIGRAAFIRLLHTTVEGKAVNGHPLRILEVTPRVDPNCCQVLYFATDKAAEIKSVLRSFGSAHVLTIGETDGFLEQGGAVNLFLTDGHMAFEVSLGALGRAGVEISSKLLRFGQIRDLAKGRAAK
jgi:YfiR/HmsC-like